MKPRLPEKQRQKARVSKTPWTVSVVFWKLSVCRSIPHLNHNRSAVYVSRPCEGYDAALLMYYLLSKEVTKNPREGEDDMKREWLFNSASPPLSWSPAPSESADAANHLHIYERSFTARLFIKCFNMLLEYGIRIESLNANAQNTVHKWISWFMAGKKNLFNSCDANFSHFSFFFL